MIDCTLPLTDGLFCHGLSVRPAELRRFARRWRDTWRRVPLADRQTMFAYWKTMPAEAGEPMPAIILSDLIRAETMGHVVPKYGGGLLNFSRRGLNLLPARLWRAILAHELCHVLQCAAGKPMDEDQADAKATGWGFAIAEARNIVLPAAVMTRRV